MSKKRNKNARRHKTMSPEQRARQRELQGQTGTDRGRPANGHTNSVQEARQRALRGDPSASGADKDTQQQEPEVRPGLFPPSRRPPRDPNRKPWETWACMIMAFLIVFLVPDWRDPDNPWPGWFYVAPLAFGVLGALFALLDKRRRLAATSAGFGLVLFLGLLGVIALTR